MKKFIALIMMLVSLVGCSCKDKPVKVKLDYEVMPNVIESSPYLYTKYLLLTKHLKSTDEYDDKIEAKDSFLLFVYSSGCYGCNLLAPAMQPYVEENEIVIYTIEYEEISDKHDLYKAGVNTTPFLLLIEEGKIVYKELVKLPEEKSEHVNWVENWMKKHVEWSEN